MVDPHLIQIRSSGDAAAVRTSLHRVLLLRPPYFTPWTPPLGIGILKSFLQQLGHTATCVDFNADPELWGMHHKYFAALAAGSRSTSNDGYSKLWWIMNAQLLAHANGASQAAQRRILELVSPLYRVHVTPAIANTLVQLVERFFARLDHLFDELDLDAYDVIGTSTYTTSLSASLWLLRRAKERSPRIRTVMGGGVFADDLALGSENLQILLDEYPWIDHVVLGEGETLLASLLDGSLSAKRVVSIADVQQQTLAMKDVPRPDFSDFDLSRYYQLTIEGARSCPFQCSFCSETIQWGEYRRKPMDNLVEQVVSLADEFEIREFFMGDSLMNPYLIPFADALTGQNAGIVYDGYLRADRPVTNRKFVKAWAASGLYRVRLGIESGSDRVLGLMDKKTTAKVIASVLKTLAAEGIRTTTYWIVGFPGETEQDFAETCEFIREHHRYIYELEAHPYYYYPYGQVASRLYQAESVYPDEVTRYTKFRVWEILAANPPREVRYQRLERLSEMAAQLALPNIYTMSERYQAEDRWRALHPAARRIFTSQPPDQESTGAAAAIPALAPVSREAARSMASYTVSMPGIVDRAVLTECVDRLAAHHDMALMKRSDSVFTPLVAGVDAAPLRVDVLSSNDTHTELALSVSQDLFDPASVVLLAEDLCRSYQQLAAGHGVFLRPASRTYRDYVHGLSPTARFGLTRDLAPRSWQTLEVPLSDAATQGIGPSCGQRRRATVRIVTAVLRVLDAASRAAIHLDPRVFDSSLVWATGPFTRIVPLPPMTASRSDTMASLSATDDCLRALATTLRPMPDALPLDVLIDVSELVEPAWMGDEDWIGGGFENGPRPAGAAPLCIAATGRANGASICLMFDPVHAQQGRQIAHDLAAAIEDIVREHDGAEVAERFWRDELGPAKERPGNDAALESEVAYARIAIRAGRGSGRAGQDATAETLAIYSLLLPVLGGSDDLPLALIDAAGQHVCRTPIRLHRTGNPRWSQFLDAAREKLRAAEQHRHFAPMLEKTLDAAFASHAFLVSPPADEAGIPVERLGRPNQRPFSSLLAAATTDTPATLWYSTRHLDRATAQGVADAIADALDRVAAGDDPRITDLFWTGERMAALEEEIAIPELSHDFQFLDQSAQG